MKAHYGYRDGSGAYFIIIDTDKCDGCGKCVEACPQGVLEVVPNDYDIEGGMMAAVKEEHRWKLKYTCGPCKPVGKQVTPPCIAACPKEAIEHSW
ncbi:MAG: ferredoxin [Thermoprotei archaeon]|nr:MAG: ferredoxin [Thermoprotei archaeon]RLF16597.1 MAG: ferredoxin [Thermoprotei archaeon]